MRPKFTIANLLMLTVIVAMAALMHRNRVRHEQAETRNRIRIEHLEDRLALHNAVREQARLVQQRQAELQAATQQMQPELDLIARYRMKGEGELAWTSPNNALQTTTGMEFTAPVGYRRGLSKVRHAQLRLARDKAVLAQLEQELNQRTAKPTTNVRTNTNY